MGYESQEGVLPVIADVLRESREHPSGADPQPASFLRCVAEQGCPGHRKDTDS